MIRILGSALAGLAGLAFGSFLNVCLTRWPAGESVVKPRSHCRNCDRTLTWWENVPLLSWVALRGRCRTCGAVISRRYAAVEFSVGVLWTTIFWQFASRYTGIEIVSFSPQGLAEALLTVSAQMWLVWLLVGLAALDAEHLWLPDAVTLTGIALGVAVTMARHQPLVAMGQVTPSLLLLSLNLAFALLIAAGIILAIRWTYWLIRRREGIGLGDAKLMAMLAAWLGLPGALLAFVIAVLAGAIVGAAVLLFPKRSNAETPALIKLPLGTFLCIGGIVSLFWGSQILSAYLRWAGFNEVSRLW
ncbi:MAG TPA: prepilin peptidase [Terracidiphilus sp.]|jgi:leader peptidase (prepilin peptidase)/N-methyltransferase|nr:prepilin peptidase [Terracidiphilus sp.]